jgi:hypothetical protein
VGGAEWNSEMSALDDIIARDSAPPRVIDDPNYKVPDGALRVDVSGTSGSAPNSSSLDDIVARDAAMKPTGAPAVNDQTSRDAAAQQDVSSAMGRIGNLLYGAAKGAADLVQAPAQIIAHETNAILQTAPNPSWNPLHDQVDKAKSIANNIVGGFDNHLRNQEQQYQADTPNSFAAGLGRVGASTLPFLATGGQSAAPQVAAASKLINALKIGGKGAAYATLTQPAIDTASSGGENGLSGGDFLSQKALQAGVGAGSALVGDQIGKLAARLIRPNTSPEVTALLNENVTPTPGQILGGGFKRAEDAATSIPVLGDLIKNSQRRAAQDLNNAAINRALSPIGDALPDGVKGRDAIDYVGTKLGNAYDTVLGKIGAVVPDQKFATDLASLTNLTQNLPQQSSDQFSRIVKNEVLDRINNGAFTSEGLKAAESNLGSIARGYAKSPDYDTRQLGTAIQEAQATIRQMVQRTNPNEAATLQAINHGYANFLRVQRAASSLGAEGGEFTPAQLQNAVKALDSSRNKGAFARGDALMQDLSEAGKNVLGNSVPDSGTPLRHAVQAGVAGIAGHSMLPAAAAGAIVPAAGGLALASAPYTELGQKLAAALLAKRPNFATPLAGAIRSGAPIVGAGISPLLLQALKDQSN